MSISLAPSFALRYKFCLSVHKNRKSLYHQKQIRKLKSRTHRDTERLKWDAKSVNNAVTLDHYKKINLLIEYACILSKITKKPIEKKKKYAITNEFDADR